MKSRLLFLWLALLLAGGRPASAERIKDIVEIQGLRGNPLQGLGLVIGLAGTGDKSLPSRQMMTNILRRSGLVLSPRDLSSGNTAVVMVTAELGPFDRKDSKIDVTVSAVEDASSLQGGQLIATPLAGVDGQVYAIAAGPVSLGGFAVEGKAASITKNHQTVGRVPSGAIVEKEEIADFVEELAGQRYITLNLTNKDFGTATRIATVINSLYADCAIPLDAGTVRICLPAQLSRQNVSAFIDEITRLEVRVDMPAVVVINERTGTIVVGERVGISSVAISQGSLVVKIKETEFVSQPIAPFSDAGTTEKVQDTTIGVNEKEGYLIPVPNLVTVSDLAKALNAIGATPRDLIAIFNALRKAGALQARLETM
jgi:flagellar P-ring protein precursor FlgI